MARVANPGRTQAIVFAALLAGLLLGAGAGCESLFINSADSIANRLIRERQQNTLGQTSDSAIGAENGLVGDRTYTHSFTPHPVDSDVPASFGVPSATEPAGSDSTMPIDTNGNIVLDADVSTTGARTLTLSEALSYAFQNSRDFQTSKETLYLAALALMTERQLWTPQLLADLGIDYTNLGSAQDWDQAMNAVANVSATQKLPYGGQIAARVVSTLIRDLNEDVTTGETGEAILEANIPLLRGAGRVAYESRYQAERDLIYAVRDFEVARRDLVVAVAGDYFDLLALKTAIASAEAARDSAAGDVPRSEALVKVGRVLSTEADRARNQLLDSTNSVINARLAYQAALDRFKIRIGMPVGESCRLVEEEWLELVEPQVVEQEAVATALKYRLDLLNTLDAIDDARRGVDVAKNNLLPQFDFTGSATVRTEPDRKNPFSYNRDYAEWRGALKLEIPLDRRAERNAYRSALIGLRRSERDYVQASESVLADVRDAYRRLEQAKLSILIQRENLPILEFRAEQARYFFDTGKLKSNRDVVEAENLLQESRNRLANSLANYRLAVLTFLRDTGTLRVDDQGHWIRQPTTSYKSAG